MTTNDKSADQNNAAQVSDSAQTKEQQPKDTQPKKTAPKTTKAPAKTADGKSVPAKTPAAKPATKAAPSKTKAAAKTTQSNDSVSNTENKSIGPSKATGNSNKEALDRPTNPEKTKPAARKSPAKIPVTNTGEPIGINQPNESTVDKPIPSPQTAAPAIESSVNVLTEQPVVANQATTVAAENISTSLTTGSPIKDTNSKPGIPIRHRNPKAPLSTMERVKKQLPEYIKLMRLNKPIGALLLLWPTLWSLWLAAKGVPRWDLLIIFIIGVFVMRSAGCVINDFADRKIDGKVKRTQDRPLAAGTVTSREAIILFVVLCLIAFGLVLFTNELTIKLSVGGLLLAASYPFMKRHTHLPQVVLGAAFAWGIPMAFTAQTGALQKEMWLIYLAVVLWTVVYDTFYAMVDRDDDLKIGVKSTAILFGEQDRIITGMLQAMTIYALILVGQRFELGKIYYASLAVAAGLFVYQQILIRYRERQACFKAFLNNNWVGAAVFAGIAGDLAFK